MSNIALKRSNHNCMIYEYHVNVLPVVHFLFAFVFIIGAAIFFWDRISLACVDAFTGHLFNRDYVLRREALFCPNDISLSNKPKTFNNLFWSFFSSDLSVVEQGAE